jgi:hypothetical protein
MEDLKAQLDNFVENQLIHHFQRVDKKLKLLCESKF